MISLQGLTKAAFLERARWSHGFYLLTVVAIATGQLSWSAMAQGSLAAWLYPPVALCFLVLTLRSEAAGDGVESRMWTLLTSVGAGVALSGGQHGELYPLFYLFWVAAPTWLNPILRLAPLAFAYVGLELAMLCAAPHFDGALLIEHLVFSLLFVGTHRLVFGGYLKWLERQQQANLAEQKQAFVQDAQDFRLGRSDSKRGQNPNDAGVQAAVASVHATIDFELDLLVQAVDLHSAVILWADPDREKYCWQIKAQRGTSAFRDQQDLALAGFLSPLLQGEAMLHFQGSLPTFHAFYYRDPAPPIQSLCAVAVSGGEEGPEGILLLDRLGPQPFSQAELAIFQRAAEHLGRSVAQERAFAQIDRQKHNHAQLYAASVRLSQALDLAQVQQSSLEALSLLLPSELALLFAVEQETHPDPQIALKAQRVSSAQPMEQRPWQSSVQAWSSGARLQSEAGMVGAARKNRVVVAPPCPASSGVKVFGDDSPVDDLGSIAIFPLSHAEQCGAVAVLMSRKPDAFSEHAMSLARILVHQIGAALQNARLYDQMQRQATTDGLTGLANHRSFQARLEESIAFARRSEQPLSVILTDIDHFKKVNDTHGHPVGDAVLREVASVLASLARKHDLVARYGGEEFVLLLPGSDAYAAQHLAERLREAVAERLMSSKEGDFRVTLSLGIAQWGIDAQSRQELIDRADQALYACKEGGRNCVRLWREIVPQSHAS